MLSIALLLLLFAVISADRHGSGPPSCTCTHKQVLRGGEVFSPSCSGDAVPAAFPSTQLAALCMMGAVEAAVGGRSLQNPGVHPWVPPQELMHRAQVGGGAVWVWVSLSFYTLQKLLPSDSRGVS